MKRDSKGQPAPRRFPCARWRRCSSSASTSTGRARRRLTARRLGPFRRRYRRHPDRLHQRRRSRALPHGCGAGSAPTTGAPSTGSSIAGACCSSTGRTRPAWCPASHFPRGGAPCSTIRCATAAGGSGSRRTRALVAEVEAAIAAGGPLGSADFERRSPGAAAADGGIGSRAPTRSTTCG